MSGWEPVWVRRVPGWEVLTQTSGRALEKQRFRVIGRANRSQLALLLKQVYHMDKSREKPWILKGISPMRLPSRQGIVETPHGTVLSNYVEVLPGDEFEIQGLAGVDLKLITRENLRKDDPDLIEEYRKKDISNVAPAEDDWVVVNGIRLRTGWRVRRNFDERTLGNYVKRYHEMLGIAGFSGLKEDRIIHVSTLRAHKEFMADPDGLADKIPFITDRTDEEDEKEGTKSKEERIRERVQEIQRKMGAPVTGRYGFGTYLRVWIFQAFRRGLKPTGLWDQPTEDAYQRTLARKGKVEAKFRLPRGLPSTSHLFHFYIIRNVGHTYLFDEEMSVDYDYAAAFTKSESSWEEVHSMKPIIKYRLLLKPHQKDKLRAALDKYVGLSAKYDEMDIRRAALQSIIRIRQKEGEATDKEKKEYAELEEFLRENERLFGFQPTGTGKSGYNCIAFIFLSMQDAGIYPKNEGHPYIPDEYKQMGGYLEFWAAIWIWVNWVVGRGLSTEEALDIGKVPYEKLLPPWDEHEEESK